MNDKIVSTRYQKVDVHALMKLSFFFNIVLSMFFIIYDIAFQSQNIYLFTDAIRVVNKCV